MKQDELGLPVAKGGGTSVETAANRVAAWPKDDQRLKFHSPNVEQIRLKTLFFSLWRGGYLWLHCAVICCPSWKACVEFPFRFDHLADRSMEHCDLTKVEIPIYQVRAARISFGNGLMDTVDVLGILSILRHCKLVLHSPATN